MSMISRAWISMSVTWPWKPDVGWWMRIFEFGVDHPLALGAAGQQQRPHAHRDADADRLHVGLYVLHRVVDREARVDGAARRVDVDRDVLVGVLGLEVDELGDDEVRDVLVDRRAEEDDPLVQQARVDVERALAARGLLDDHWDQGAHQARQCIEALTVPASAGRPAARPRPGLGALLLGRPDRLARGRLLDRDRLRRFDHERRRPSASGARREAARRGPISRRRARSFSGAFSPSPGPSASISSSSETSISSASAIAASVASRRSALLGLVLGLGRRTPRASCRPSSGRPAGSIPRRVELALEPLPHLVRRGRGRSRREARARSRSAAASTAASRNSASARRSSASREPRARSPRAARRACRTPRPRSRSRRRARAASSRGPP